MKTPTTPQAPALWVPRVALVGTFAVGEIDALGTKDVSFTDARLIYPGLSPGLVVPILAFIIVPSDAPLVVCETTLDSDITGTVQVTFYNPQNAPVDFGDRLLLIAQMSAFAEPS